jgi:hypothetical protein
VYCWGIFASFSLRRLKQELGRVLIFGGKVKARISLFFSVLFLDHTEMTTQNKTQTQRYLIFCFGMGEAFRVSFWCSFLTLFLLGLGSGNGSEQLNGWEVQGGGGSGEDVRLLLVCLDGLCIAGYGLCGVVWTCT